MIEFSLALDLAFKGGYKVRKNRQGKSSDIKIIVVDDEKEYWIRCR